jgi:hypothetical protein
MENHDYLGYSKQGIPGSRQTFFGNPTGYLRYLA